MKRFFNTWAQQSPSVDLLAQLFMQTPAATAVTDDKGVVLMINHAFTELTGYDEAETIGEPMSLLKSGKHDHAFYKYFWQKLLDSGQQDCDIYNRCKDDRILLMREKVMRFDSRGRQYFVVTLEDITQQKKLADRYRHLATHDALTGLANRTLLNDRFFHASLNATRSGQKIGLLMCDLNGFKPLNDSYGHSFGDTVLQAVAEKLTQLVRISDTVARYGGDEFVLILEQIEHSDEVLAVVDEINKVFPIPCGFDGEGCSIDMSVGHACFPDDGGNLEQLINLADAKMYQAKKCYSG